MRKFIFKKRKDEEQFFNQEELRIIADQIYNDIVKEGLLYVQLLDKKLDKFNKKEKVIIMDMLRSNPELRFEDDIIQLQETTKLTSSQQEILAALIKPEYIDTKPNFVQIGSKYYMGQTCVGLPDVVSENWLSELIREKSDVDFAIHVEPSSIATMIHHLKKQLKKVKNDIYLNRTKGKDDPILEQKSEELSENIKNIAKGKYKLYNTSIHIMSKGVTPEEADTLSKKVQSTLKSGGIITKSAINYQQQLVKSIIPSSINHLDKSNILVPDNALAASFPFSSPFDTLDEEEGILLGWNENNLPIAKNMWAERSYSGAFLGPTGTGKSYTAKFFIDQENTIRGTRIIIIDPAASQGARPEYKRMCEKKKGSYVSFSKESKNIPPILKIYSDYIEDMQAIEYILSVMLGGVNGVSDAQKAWLEKGIRMALEMADIKEENPKTWKKTASLENLHTAFKKLFYEAKTDHSKASIEALSNRLSRFIGKGLYSFINKHTKDLELDNKFTVLELKQIPEEIKPTVSAIIMNLIKAQATKDTHKTLIVLEEAHLWLKDPVLSEFLSTLMVIVRKSNTGVVLIFQDVGQLNNCKEGETLINNMMFTYIMGCGPSLLNKSARIFNLNENEKEVVLQCNIGSGILIWNQDHYKVNIKIDPETHKVITTNPEEIKKIEIEEEEQSKELMIERLKLELGYDTTIEKGITELAKLLAESPELDLSDYPTKYHTIIRGEVEKTRKDIMLKKIEEEKIDKVLKFWLRKGKKNIITSGLKKIMNNNVQRKAGKLFDLHKAANKYYKKHPTNTKPMHLTTEEDEVYRMVAASFVASDKKKSPEQKTKKPDNSIYMKIGKGDTKKGKQTAKTLLKNTIYIKQDLDIKTIENLKLLGYTESKNDVYDLSGKRVTVLGKSTVNESLQHLTYKYLFSLELPETRLEYKGKKTGMEIDVVVPLPNNKILGLEIQTSVQRPNEIIAKLNNLDKETDYWILCCKKKDIPFYERFLSGQGKVLTFKQALDKVKLMLSRA